MSNPYDQYMRQEGLGGIYSPGTPAPAPVQDTAPQSGGFMNKFNSFMEAGGASALAQATPQQDPSKPKSLMDVGMDTHSSTAQGAQVGFAMGGPWGALAGGIAGTIKGLGTGLWEYYESQDAERKKRELLNAEQRRLSNLQGAYNRDRFNQAREAARLGQIREEQSMAEWKYKRYKQNQELMRGVQDRMNSQILDLASRGQGTANAFTRLGV